MTNDKMIYTANFDDEVLPLINAYKQDIIKDIIKLENQNEDLKEKNEYLQDYVNYLQGSYTEKEFI